MKPAIKILTFLLALLLCFGSVCNAALISAYADDEDVPLGEEVVDCDNGIAEPGNGEDIAESEDGEEPADPEDGEEPACSGDEEPIGFDDGEEPAGSIDEEEPEEEKEEEREEKEEEKNALEDTDLYAGEYLCLSGMLPVGAVLEAAQSDVQIPGEKMVTALDLRVRVGEGEEERSWQPEEELVLRVRSDAFEGLEQLAVYSMGSANAFPSFMGIFSPEEGWITFRISRLGLYAVTEVTEKPLYKTDYATYAVTVIYDNSSGLLAGAELNVREIVRGRQYDSYVSESAEQIGAEVEELEVARVFDIYLTYPGSGEHIDLSGNVQVSIRLLDEQAELLDDTASVVHFGEETETMETSVKDDSLQFETDSFSVYVVVQAEKALYEDKDFWNDSSDLDGKGFYICAQPYVEGTNDSRSIYFMLSSSVRDDNINQLRKTAANDICSAEVFYFQEISAGNYHIWCRDPNDSTARRFLRASYGGDARNLDLASETEASTFTVNFVGTEARIECGSYHINMKRNHTGAGFQVYNQYGANDAPVRMIYAGDAPLSAAADPYGLDQTSWVILSYVSGKTGRAATATPADSNKKLAAEEVTVTTNSAGTPLTVSKAGGEATLWTFHACENGKYMLQAGSAGYLQIYGSSIKLVASDSDATPISVTPANSEGTYSGRYRFSVINEKNYAVALAIGTNMYGLAGNTGHDGVSNNNGHSDPYQWLYLAKPAKLEISREDYSGKYDGISHTGGAVTATYNGTAVDVSTLTLEYSTDEVNWSATDPTALNVSDSKTAYVRASSTEYGSSDAASYSLTVQQRGVTLTSETFSKTYDGTALTRPDVTVGGDGFVSGELGSVSATGSVTNVAEGAVVNTIAYTTASGFVAGNYSITLDEGTLSINPASITIKAEDKSKEYDNNSTTDPALTATVTGKPTNGVEPVYVLSRESGQNARDYTITVTVSAASNPNYTISTAEGTFRITRAQLTITAKPQEYEYSGSAQGENNATYMTGLDSKVSVTGLKDGDTLTSVTLNGVEMNAGEYDNKIMPSAAAVGTATGNYDISYVAGKLTITKAALTVTAKEQQYTYNASARGEDHATYSADIGSKVEVTGLKGSDALTSVTLDGRETNAGEYVSKIMPSAVLVGDATDNYTIACVAGKLTVTPAPLTITVKDQSYIYDTLPHGEDHAVYTDASEIAAKVTVEGLQGDDALTGITLDGVETDAGVYAGRITPSEAHFTPALRGAVTGNYDVTYAAGTLTIEGAKLTLTVKKLWDDENDKNGKRPSRLTVELKADGKSLTPAVTVTLNKENDWTATVTDLPKYNGTAEIVYSWSENAIENYTLSKTENKTVDGATAAERTVVTTLTNTYRPTTSTTTPKTGDESQTALWACMMLVSLLSIAAVSILRTPPKRRKGSHLPR